MIRAAHTATPWRVELVNSEQPGIPMHVIMSGEGFATLIARTCFAPDSKANADRIVAAVNAVDGFATEDLATLNFGAAIAELLSQRAELLAALKAVVYDLEYGTTGRWKGEGIKSIRAAITRATIASATKGVGQP